MPRGPKPIRLPSGTTRVETTPVVVGIDASPTGTGLVAITLDGELVANRRLRSVESGVERLAAIRRGLTLWLSEVEGVHFEHYIEHICLEQYAFGATGRGLSPVHEVGGTIKLTLFDLYTRPLAFPTMPVPSQVKKFATGKGTAPKDQISKFVLKKWGADMPNNDEADAYALARIAQALVLKKTTTQYEADVIKALKDKSAIHAELPNEEKYELDLWR